MANLNFSYLARFNFLPLGSDSLVSYGTNMFSYSGFHTIFIIVILLLSLIFCHLFVNNIWMILFTIIL